MATTAKATKPTPTASKPKKGAVNSGKMLVVTQTGGATGKGPKMQETLIGLGLGRIRSSRELQDTPSIRGMITRVRHLVSVEEKK